MYYSGKNFEKCQTKFETMCIMQSVIQNGQAGKKGGQKLALSCKKISCKKISCKKISKKLALSS